jgi:hypothetical protein
MNIISLPLEILFLILTCVTNPIDLLRLSGTCKLFKCITTSDIFMEEHLKFKTLYNSLDRIKIDYEKYKNKVKSARKQFTENLDNCLFINSIKTNDYVTCKEQIKKISLVGKMDHYFKLCGQYNNIKALELIIKNIRSNCYPYKTAFYEGMINGNIEICDCIYDKLMHSSYEIRYLLERFCANGCIDGVKYIINKGNIIDYSHYMHLAIDDRKYEILQLLLDEKNKR